MLVNFNDSESLFIILVGNGLDTGGLSCSRITEKKTVIGLSSLHKSLGVFNELLLWNLIAYQIVQMHMGNIPDRSDLHLRALMYDPEGLMQTKPAHAVVLIKLCQRILHFFRRMIFFKLHGQTADPIPDPAVIYLALFPAGLVAADQVIALCSQRRKQGPEIIVKKFLKDPNVM